MSDAKELIATVGTFDGVHRGHRALLSRLIEVGGTLGLQPAVVTFRRHPLAVIAPANTPRRLTTVDEQQMLLNQLVDRVIMVDFDQRLRRMTAKEFLRMLSHDYNVKAFLIGFNNHIGNDRLGYGDELIALGKELGIRIILGTELTDDGEINSSTIRSLIMGGRLGDAVRLMGHPYPLSGCVGHGKALGRTIGFPTANLEVADPDKLLPGVGVYAGYVEISGTRYAVMVNIGHRPTVDHPDAPLSVEAHIIDYQGDLYGKTITLHLLARIRGEQRFDSVEALKEQLTQDKAATAALVREWG